MKDPSFDDDNTVLEARSEGIALEETVDLEAIPRVVPGHVEDDITAKTPVPQRLAPTSSPMAAAVVSRPTPVDPPYPPAPDPFHARATPYPEPGRYPARASAPYPATPDPQPVRASTPFPVPSDPDLLPVRAASPTPSSVEARLASLSLEKGPAATEATRSWSKLPWILLVLVAGGGAFYHYTTIRNLKETPAEAPHDGAHSAVGKAPEPSAPSGSLLASGYIAAKIPIVLSATTSGRLQELKVDNGDTITKGQVLAVIADGPLRAELGLAAARVRDAERAYKRMRMLAKAEAATPADLEHAMGAVEVARAAWQVTKQNLEQTRIKSPIDGTVVEVLAHSGESITVGPGQTGGILKIADLSALDAEVDVAETELKSVRVGQSAEVISDSQRGRRYRGKVREIAQQADRARGTVLVKVDILGELEHEEAKPTADSVGSGSADPTRSGAAGSGTAQPPKDGFKPGMAIQVRFLSAT